MRVPSSKKASCGRLRCICKSRRRRHASTAVSGQLYFLFKDMFVPPQADCAQLALPCSANYSNAVLAGSTVQACTLAYYSCKRCNNRKNSSEGQEDERELCTWMQRRYDHSKVCAHWCSCNRSGMQGPGNGKKKKIS